MGVVSYFGSRTRNQYLAANREPALTTIRVPAAKLGRRAAEYLSARLEKTPTPEKTHLQAALVVRETKAPPAPRRKPGVFMNARREDVGS
jgi:DNA-binding LacI/PurR family transcriptional regulator